MLSIIRNILQEIINNIDAGNSKATEEEQIKCIKLLRTLTDKNEKLNKYQSCRYLKVSRSTFDNYVRADMIPKGKRQAGYKELFWFKKDLDKFKEERDQ